MNTADVLVRIDGEVESPASFTFPDLLDIDGQHQIADVSSIAPKRVGGAVTLDGLLARVNVTAQAKYIGLHASRDDFHASVPLDAIRERAIVIYRREDSPLSVNEGGPVRLFIPDHAACHVAEIDECANVKFIDHIELTVERGFDNRPQDDEEHEKLHADE
jgi:DMSO/TMAO reductase YedYZ molybdopterin-dependent catalytic subunit